MFKPFWGQFTIVNSDASITATDAAHLCLHHREILTTQGTFREKLNQITLSRASSNDPQILMESDQRQLHPQNAGISIRGISQSIWRKGVEDEARIFSVVPSNRTGNNIKSCTGSSIWMRKNFTVLVTCTGTDFPGRLWSFPHCRYSTTPWIQSCTMCCGMSLLAHRG